MMATVTSSPVSPRRTPWNKGKLIGAKPPLRIKNVWAIRSTLQLSGRTRDLALFNLGIREALDAYLTAKGRLRISVSRPRRASAAYEHPPICTAAR
jgi:hypothetical protein